MRDVSSVEFSGAQQICYSHLPPGFFVSGQRRLWERQLSPTQSIGCWWTSRRFWWRSRETCRLFSCSCKDHKIFPSLQPSLSWPVGLQGCRCEEAECEQQTESRAGGRHHVLLVMICSDWDWLFSVHAREARAELEQSLSPQFSPHLCSPPG